MSNQFPINSKVTLTVFMGKALDGKVGTVYEAPAPTVRRVRWREWTHTTELTLQLSYLTLADVPQPDPAPFPDWSPESKLVIKQPEPAPKEEWINF